MSRELLPTAAAMRDFAELVGMKGSMPQKREQGVNQLVRYMAGLQHDKVVRALENTSVAPRDLGVEYERWVRLILGGHETN